MNKEQMIEKVKQLKEGGRFVVVSEPVLRDWVSRMGKYCGKMLTIESVDHNCYLTFRAKGISWAPDYDHINLEATLKLNNVPLFTKNDLKSGDKVVYRDGRERYVLIETGTLHHTNGVVGLQINRLSDDLTCRTGNETDIMKVYRGEELIFEREEKTANQLEIESIEAEMRKLADRLEALKESKGE